MKCRFCAEPLSVGFADLGTAPPSNAFLTAPQLREPETWFPLELFTCLACGLVQVDEHQDHRRLFDADYVYFSSFSSPWLAHARDYAQRAIERVGLGSNSRVLEVASNDGYLLRHFRDRGIPCVGIEPTAGTAAAARAQGIETIERFFGREAAAQFRRDRGPVDLVIANNVLAHVPDINDFVAGFAQVLAGHGVITLEFPHLMQLVAHSQFDTIYHEHFSYLSLATVQRIFAAHGLAIWDVQSLPTHGGSLRVWAQRAGGPWAATPAVAAMLETERAAGMQSAAYYSGFQVQAESVKNTFLRFLLDCRRDGRSVAAYGAAAKGNTLLNFAGVRADLLPFVVDASPHKQGRFLPGSRIPVVAEARLREARPDFVVILPWNLRDEIAAQLSYIGEWGGRFVTAVPGLDVFDAVGS